MTYRHGTGPLAKQVRVVAEVINESDREVPASSTVRAHQHGDRTPSHTGKGGSCGGHGSQMNTPSAAPRDSQPAAYPRRTVVERRFDRARQSWCG
nr:hypothetical protein GCM10020241_16240 [Streptoalloteichus tenebrarius]